MPFYQIVFTVLEPLNSGLVPPDGQTTNQCLVLVKFSLQSEVKIQDR